MLGNYLKMFNILIQFYCALLIDIYEKLFYDGIWDIKLSNLNHHYFDDFRQCDVLPIYYR